MPSLSRNNAEISLPNLIDRVPLYIDKIPMHGRVWRSYPLDLEDKSREGQVAGGGKM